MGENHEKSICGINSLSFDSMQDDSSAVLFTYESHEGEANAEWWKNVLEIGEPLMEKYIDNIFEGKSTIQKAEDVINQNRKMEETSKLAERKALAKQIVSSVNIIYMFTEALRIIITDSHINLKVHNLEQIKQYRYKLIDLDENLVHKVYSHLSDQEMGMFEYREKKGINSQILSDQEIKAEQYEFVGYADKSTKYTSYRYEGRGTKKS